MIRTSEQINEIAAATAKAQADLENVERGGTNPHFHSKYAKLGAVLDEVRGKFAKHGVSVWQAPVNGDGENIGVVTRLAHSSGQWIESTLYVRPTKFDAQGAGSVISYIRRYALMAMAGIAPDDDDAEAAVGRPVAPQPRQQPRTNGNGTNGAGLPPNPVEPPEVAAARDRVRDLIAKVNHHIKTAPSDHALDLAMEDSREELAEIERAGPAGVEAANTLRARYNARISALRGGAAA